MRADKAVKAGDDFKRRRRLQRQRQACAIGGAADIAHARTGAGGGAQRVVVHDVVSAVVEQLRFHLGQPRREMALFQPQAQAVAAELAAIHAACGVAGLAVASAHAQLGQGVGIGCPAQFQIGVPLFVGRMHTLACAITVVIAV